jgi:hypothetical protein
MSQMAAPLVPTNVRTQERSGRAYGIMAASEAKMQDKV